MPVSKSEWAKKRAQQRSTSAVAAKVKSAKNPEKKTSMAHHDSQQEHHAQMAADAEARGDAASAELHQTASDKHGEAAYARAAGSPAKKYSTEAAAASEKASKAELAQEAKFKKYDERDAKASDSIRVLPPSKKMAEMLAKDEKPTNKNWDMDKAGGHFDKSLKHSELAKEAKASGDHEEAEEHEAIATLHDKAGNAFDLGHAGAHELADKANKATAAKEPYDPTADEPSKLPTASMKRAMGGERDPKTGIVANPVDHHYEEHDRHDAARAKAESAGDAEGAKAHKEARDAHYEAASNHEAANKLGGRRVIATAQEHSDRAKEASAKADSRGKKEKEHYDPTADEPSKSPTTSMRSRMGGDGEKKERRWSNIGGTESGPAGKPSEMRFGGNDPENEHYEKVDHHEQEARRLSAEGKTKEASAHRLAAETHGAAGDLHRKGKTKEALAKADEADAKSALANRNKSAPGEGEGSVHSYGIFSKKQPASQSTETGSRGGKYYMSPNGTKVYVK